VTGQPTPPGQARSARIAWVVFGATAAVGVAALGLAMLNRSAQPLAESVFFLLPVGYALLGALITSRQPGNAIGWLYLVSGLWLGLSAGLLQEYAVYTLVVDPGSLPSASIVLWLQSPALDTLFFLLVSLLLLLFPTGRPLTRRWWVAVWSAAVGAVLGLSQGFQPLHMDAPLKAFDNPFIAHGRLATVLDWAGTASQPLVLAGLLGGVVSAVLRFKRSQGIERLQLRWFAAAVATALATIVATIVSYVLTGRSYDSIAFFVLVTVLPAATGIAILRYRLYEIDVLIRKSLVYACLIAGLAGLYLAGVVGLGALSRLIIHQSGVPAVTASTLIVAAAFQPLRTRIQRAVDHRFYRARYDAARTLDAFSGRLREQIDLEALSDEVLGVVRSSLHPSHATLWLRPTGEGE